MRIISGTARGTKLYTLKGDNTRPTLDRVRESVFNIIQNEIRGSKFLDLFSGSGAIGIEAISRGAEKAILCDKSREAIKIIKMNLQKTHFEEKAFIYNTDYKTCLKSLNEQFDLIYLDPPYETKFIKSAINIILDLGLLKDNSVIIAETDKIETIEELEKMNIEIVDTRRYGRIIVTFIKKCN